MRVILILIAGTAILPACDRTQTNNSSDIAATADKVTMDDASAIDPNIWLEDIEGERALAWVRKQNERSLQVIQGHEAYEGNLSNSLELATSRERIPYGSIRNGLVYNFWQDDTNVRGLWRRTTLASYESREPDWETVLDFDELAKTESKNWVFKGSDCLNRQGSKTTHCMVSLSDGGKDAVIQREFDLDEKAFVDDGFVTTEAKQDAAWVDKNTLLIGTDWGNDGSTLTESGYPASVRLWKRGQSLEEAEELFAGQKTDVGVFPWSSELQNGHVVFGAVESDTFFTSTYWLSVDGGVVKIPIPPKSSIAGLYKNYQFVTLRQDWAIEAQGENFRNGDLIAFDIERFLDTKSLPPVELMFRANERQAVNGVSVAKGAVLLSINDNVVATILRLEPGQNGWTTTPIDLPGAGQASIAFAEQDVATVFINYEGFLTPDSLLKYDAKTGDISPLKSLPAKFDVDGLVVHQRHATSRDGTRIPYFIVHRSNLETDGSTPTLLYGYGGFEVSMAPSYSGGIGRMWLEKGGAFAVANIRGGGEFGPTWHQAGLKDKRQRVYDDFIAVGEDLIAENITSARHLGIMGGSNGGLLMGVMITQRPELWNAVVIQVPLLDMLRYHKLLAGASWVDEYGDPDIPEERAFLETISPYHNFDVTKDYPVPLFVTSTKDDRVHPGHARKMAKLFEAAEKPFLYYENIDGGHSAAANQKERAKRSALEFTYLTERLFPVPE